MKDLTKIIQKGNLTPRERALLVIKHDAHLLKTGKVLLSEADLIALTSWRPQNNYEVEQYNKVMSLWDLYQKLQIDMQTCYLTTQLVLSRLEHSASMVYYRSDSFKPSRPKLNSSLFLEDDAEFRAFFLEHSGYEYDRLVHLCTFYSLPEDIQKDVLRLDPYVTSDHKYFLEEEQIARIIGNKKNLTAEDVDTLTKNIINSIPWGYELRLPNAKISFKEVIFNLHFAEYPIMEFGRRLASRYNIKYETHDELREKLSEVDDLEYKLEKVVRDTISDGSFFDEFKPLCLSSDCLTQEGKTVLPHDELMKRWIKAKDSVIKTIERYINTGDLEVHECPIRFFEISINKTFITGTSLEQAKLTLPFTKDFVSQIDESMHYFLPAFLVYKSSVFENYQYLLKFKEVTVQLSEIIGVDLSETITNHLESVCESVDTLSFYLRQMNDKLLERSSQLNVQYPLQTFMPDPSLVLRGLEAKENESLKVFAERIEPLLR